MLIKFYKQRKCGADSFILTEALTKPESKETATIPTPVSLSVGYTQSDTDEMVLSFILTFMETVRFLLKDSAKTLSPNMYVSGHST